MRKKIIAFHHCKNLILREDVDIDNLLIPAMVSFSEKRVYIM